MPILPQGQALPARRRFQADRELTTPFPNDKIPRTVQPDHHMMEHLNVEMSQVLYSTIPRLLLAAILGGIIGLEREFRHKPAGLRTNMLICFGAAMFTVLSTALAGSNSESSRISAQIITGIGFIGAGSILHARGSVTGLTTAATIFVVASVGMAAGGGLYVTAFFATALIITALNLLGRFERRFALKSVLMTYEVSGRDTEAVVAELNRILDAEKQRMQNLRVAGSDGLSRVLFSVDSSPGEQQQLNLLLRQSPVFSAVTSLGAIDHE
ncbi:MAG TPA: MgtC/SapB family protein [Terriglobales bacterium]